MAEHLVVLVTCGSEEEAHTLAGRLVEARLAACVNVVPGVVSHYWWEGRVQSDAEWLLLIKTRLELLETLIQRVRAWHSYEEPEVIALPIVGGSPSYLAWIQESTQASDDERGGRVP
ncbi:MAG: divalent-cation tolerance protein CutA [Anaerolineae bacterium]|nr:divalent-cation tolerance protein CutA [Anaerolineae bacterium]